MLYLFWPYSLPYIEADYAMHYWTYYDDGTYFSYIDVIDIETFEDIITRVLLRKFIYDYSHFFVKEYCAYNNYLKWERFSHIQECFPDPPPWYYQLCPKLFEDIAQEESSSKPQSH